MRAERFAPTTQVGRAAQASNVTIDSCTLRGGTPPPAESCWPCECCRPPAALAAAAVAAGFLGVAAVTALVGWLGWWRR